MRVQWRSFAAFFGLSLLLAGCTSVVEVNGTVKTSSGEAVKGGTLVFTAAGGSEGKPRSAEIQEDGNFTVTPGLSLGEYQVSYSPPEQEMTEEQRKDPNYSAPPPPYRGMVPKNTTIEVASGNTSIDVELVKK